MTHALERNDILKLLIPQIKYFYGIGTNRELLQKIGYSSPTYLSDTIKGKTAVSDKFIAKLSEVFLINPDVFDGKSCDVFLPTAGFNVSVDPKSGEVMNDSKNVHVHIGDTKSDHGGTTIENAPYLTIAKDTTASLEKMAQMHETTVAALKQSLESNQKIIQDMTRQNEETQKAFFEEIRAQRELFYSMLKVIKNNPTQSADC